MTDDDSPQLTRDIAPFGVRMPADLKERVQAAAKANGRSTNAEIVATLSEAYPEPLSDPLTVLLNLTSALVRVIDPEDEAASADLDAAIDAAKALYGETGAFDRAQSIIKMLENLEEISGRHLTDADAKAIVERAMQRRKLTKGAD